MDDSSIKQEIYRLPETVQLALRKGYDFSLTPGMVTEFAFIEDLSKKGYHIATLIEAICYLRGVGAKKDEDRYLKIVQRLAYAGYPAAKYELGSYLLRNPSKVIDGKEGAFVWIKSAADTGNVKAQNETGVCYASGIGVSNDNEKAKHYFELASLSNYSHAYYNLGLLYKIGSYPIERNEPLAFSYFEKASVLGHVRAKTELADFYLRGSCVEKNEDIAHRLYAEASNLGDYAASLELGLAWDRQGKKRDVQKAISYYTRAADAMYGPALARLAIKYLYGDTGVPRDTKLAIEAINDGVSVGDRNCLFLLAVCHETGLIENSNRKLAFNIYFKLATKRCHARASMRLAVCYFEGIGTEVNKREALRWFMLNNPLKAVDPRVERYIRDCRDAIAEAENGRKAKEAQ
jgi:TPR repeat protein